MIFKDFTPSQIYNNKQLLKDFLVYYSEKTGEKNLNANCENCITDYYKKLITKMENPKLTYVLKPKYHGIFCDGVYLTNANITDALAKKLLKVKNQNPDYFFLKYPVKAEKEIKQTETKESESKQ